MTTATAPRDGLPPRLTRLAFHGPRSEARAAATVRRLAGPRPGSMLDGGCGWGELMLRLLTALPQARGVGVDVNAAGLERGGGPRGRGGLPTGWSSPRSRRWAPAGARPAWWCAADGQSRPPLATETRERLDAHRAAWLTYRGVLGPGHLTLVPTARSH